MRRSLQGRGRLRRTFGQLGRRGRSATTSWSSGDDPHAGTVFEHHAGVASDAQGPSAMSGGFEGRNFQTNVDDILSQGRSLSTQE